MEDVFFVYILKSENNKLYIGQTNNLKNRQNFHKWGVASKFTRQNKGPHRLVYSEEYKTRKEAMKREKQLKKWSRTKKEALISGDLELLKKL
ncbi:GIY-YIG nuclease family protein [Patescibacteria group bacterium]|nr:GIY-YIG nuclease family protein [Patescibacteria group bacterium]